MSDELKPCPFCGSTPKFGYHGDDDGGYYYVECRSCSRPADLEAERFIGAHADNHAEAITAWNRRPSTAPSSVMVPLSDDQVERLRLWACDDMITPRRVYFRAFRDAEKYHGIVGTPSPGGGV